MSTLTLKLKAAKTTSAWQLALDKYPFDVQRPAAPWLTQPDDRHQEQSIKPHRLREIKDRASAASTVWKAVIAKNMCFLDTLEKQHGSHFRRIALVNSSRLLLHLGRASVLENVGLYCDRTTGLPIIPGSAVKGVVSTWACWDGNGEAIYNPNAQGEITLEKKRAHFIPLAQRILGDNADNGSTEAGEVIFLGAFPAEVPWLGLDIVTPHTDAIGHDRSPVPNPFLAIEAGTTWYFAFIAKPRQGATDADALLKQTAEWLAEALAQNGIGAKTAAGYGRFVTDAAWQAATMTADDRAKAHAGAKREAEAAASLAAMKARKVGDYDNEATFANLVLKKLNPGQLNQLEPEMTKLTKPENELWRLKLTEALRGPGMKELRKKLKDKAWFKQEWFPQ